MSTDITACKPGCIGRNEGSSQNSGGIGLQPDQSKTPSIYKKKGTFLSEKWVNFKGQCNMCIDAYRKPSLPPRGHMSDTAMVKNPLAGSRTSIVQSAIGSFPENTHANVAKSCTKHGAVTLYM